MTILFSILIILFLGVCYRLRGGLFQQLTGDNIGDTVSRIAFWGVPVACMFLACGLDWKNALVAGVLAFATTTFGNFDAIDLGTRDGTFTRDALMLALKGLLTGGLPALAFLFTDHCPFALIALTTLMPLWYWLAKLYPWRIKGFGYGDGAATGYDFPETGELYFGLAFGLGLVLSTL